MRRAQAPNRIPSGKPVPDGAGYLFCRCPDANRKSHQMKNNAEERDQWPRIITHGRIKVSVYRRKSPKGNHCYMVANYADGRRRFDSYHNETEAIEAANKLARQMSEREVVAA